MSKSLLAVNVGNVPTCDQFPPLRMNALADSRMPLTESAPEFKSPETGGTGKPAETNDPPYAPERPEALETTPGWSATVNGLGYLELTRKIPGDAN